jgi:DNA gyrase subunit A
MVVTITSLGYIKRQPLTAYRRQRRGGKGIIGMDLREGDFVKHLFIASTHDYMLFFTNRGKVYGLKVHEIPVAPRTARGKAIVNLLNLAKGEVITACIPVREFSKDRYLILVTSQGYVKKMKLDEFGSPRRSGIIAISLNKGDQLIGAVLSDGKRNIFLATRKGKSICFPEEELRPMGRTAQGVRGIKLSKEDQVVSMCCVYKDGDILSVSENGYGKRTSVKEYTVQSRAGKGIINMKVTQKTGDVIGTEVVYEEDDLMFITQSGQVVRIAVKDIRPTGRNTSGVRVVRTSEEDKVVSFAKVVKEG